MIMIMSDKNNDEDDLKFFSSSHNQFFLSTSPANFSSQRNSSQSISFFPRQNVFFFKAKALCFGIEFSPQKVVFFEAKL